MTTPLEAAAALRAAAEWVQAPRSHRIRGHYLTRADGHLYDGQSYCVLGAACYHAGLNKTIDDDATGDAIQQLACGDRGAHNALGEAFSAFDESARRTFKGEQRYWSRSGLEKTVFLLLRAATRLEAAVAKLNAPEPTPIPSEDKELSHA